MQAARRGWSPALITVAFGLGVCTPFASGQTTVYTLDSHFDQGALLNVNHDDPNNHQLQLDTEATPFRFLNVATINGAGPRVGTIVRIDVDTGEVVGEYRTAPDGRLSNPSRTTVDLFGNVWAGNRDEPLRETGDGSVVKVGLIVGGTRCDAGGNPDPNGQYLKPPFDYSTAVDRDGDGLIRTSRGLGDILDWPSGTDGDGGLAGGPAPVEDALDECILIYQRTATRHIRHLSVDGQSDIWIGGYNNAPTSFEKLDGSTGTILHYFDAPGCGGYGGLVDSNGILWSASKYEASLLRYDPDHPSGAVCLPIDHSYGLGVDPQGFIWNSQRASHSMAKVAPDGTIVFKDKEIPGASHLRGVAVTSDGDIWVADCYNHSVYRLDSNGDVIGTSIPVGLHPTGMAVDSNGKIWACCQDSSSAHRIDPDLGTSGAVDMTINLTPNSQPYNFSDMTGAVAFTNTFDVGFWEVIHDGLEDNADWGIIRWSSTEPPGSALGVEARAANNPASLSGLEFTPVADGIPFDLVGRYIEIRVRFDKAQQTEASPVLYDLSISRASDCVASNRRQPGSLLLFPEFDNVSGQVTVLTTTNVGDEEVDVEFVYIDAEDCQEFNRTETFTGHDTLTLITNFHNPGMEIGYVYAFAKGPASGEPVVHNGLIGQVMRIDGIISFEYSVDAVSFEGLGDGTKTDLDDDGVRDLDGDEYTMAPGSILVPRFIGQHVTMPEDQLSHLILIGLTGGPHFTTTVDFLIYNDNEESFSSEYTFFCWDKPNLLDISMLFENEFLKMNTDHASDEVLGADHIETGWFRVDGAVASSVAHSIPDPAIYAVLIDRVGARGASDLPFELCSQDNGDLVAQGLHGDD